MNAALEPGPRHGSVEAPASKSVLHRQLILAALSKEESFLVGGALSADTQATAACLKALGASVREENGGIRVRPVETPAKAALFPCGESATTLRFFLPLAGALGTEGAFLRAGRLPERPIEPLVSELTAHGMRITEEGSLLRAEGKLQAGEYRLSGGVSSQMISGLLLALPLAEGESRLTVEPPVESTPYIRLTEAALARTRVTVRREGDRFEIPGGQRPHASGRIRIEGDWSAAAFFLCMGALSPEGITVTGPDPHSLQGDRAIVRFLRQMGAEAETLPDGAFVRKRNLRGGCFDLRDTPDLAPPLAALAALAEGETVLTGIARLRQKESDRVSALAALIRDLGGEAEETKDSLRIAGGGLRGGTADPRGDHRIAMAAAVAAAGAPETVIVKNAEWTAKSYP